MSRVTLQYSILMIAVLAAGVSAQWTTITAAEYDQAAGGAMSKAYAAFPSVFTSRTERFTKGKSVYVEFQVNERPAEHGVRVTRTITARGSTKRKYMTVTGPHEFYCSADGTRWTGSFNNCMLLDGLFLSFLPHDAVAEYSVRTNSGREPGQIYRKYAVFNGKDGKEFAETLTTIYRDNNKLRSSETRGTLKPHPSPST